MSTSHTTPTSPHKELDNKEIEKLAKGARLNRDIPFQQEVQVNPFEKFGQMQMFFIQDFALKSLKTFKNRKGRRLVVGKEEESVEMIPNDVVIKTLQADVNCSGSGVVKYCTANANQFDFSVNTGSKYTSESSWKQPASVNKIEIVKSGIYEIEFAFGLTSITNLGAIKFAIEQNGTEILKDKQERPLVMVDYNDPTKTYATPITTLSGYRSGKIELTKGDLIEYVTTANYLGSGSFTLDKTYTYRSIHYFSSNR